MPASRPSWVQNLAADRQPREPSYREEDHYDPQYTDGLHDPAHDHRAPHFDHTSYDPLPLQDPARGQQAAGDRYDDILYGQSDHPIPAAATRRMMHTTIL